MRCGGRRRPRPGPGSDPLLHPVSTPLPRADTGPRSRQVSVPGNLGAAVLRGLGRLSEYDITVLAYYRDGARSDPVSLRYTPRR